ncbi:MAG: hypothetical protein IJM20_03885 [Clostridia bacterium]|nr:hypothetical protein [Clostridia bacterium]
MRMNLLKKLAACALALLFAVTVLPAAFTAKAADVEPLWTVPSGYNEHDYNALASFLEQTDASGVKNGEKLSSTYNVNDPSTWGSAHFTFTTVSNKKRIEQVYMIYLNLVGTLDLSDCTSLGSVLIYGNRIEGLNVSGCSALHTLYCYDNRISELGVSGNSSLGYFNCSRNRIAQLDVSGNTNLVIFNCSYNPIGSLNVASNTRLVSLGCSGTNITEIDVSHNTSLKDFYCKDNALTEIDLSHNSQLPLNTIGVQGNGTIGTELINTGNTKKVYAVPDENETFIGWYNASGTLLSEDAEYTFYTTPSTTMIAHFTENGPISVLRGDVDLDGDVDVTDALLALRYAMGVITLTDEQIASGDMDGNGTINATDAIQIMRVSLGVS